MNLSLAADSGSVQNLKAAACVFKLAFNNVAGSTGVVADDGVFTVGQAVRKGRFSCIWFSEYCDFDRAVRAEYLNLREVAAAGNSICKL